MRMVLLILVVVMIVVTALSFIPEEEGFEGKGPEQLKVIKENEKFYEKIGVKDVKTTPKMEIEEKKITVKKIQPNKEEKKEVLKKINKGENDIISLPKEEDIAPKTNTTPENKISLEIIDWNLKGQQKNILVTSFKISNGFAKSVKKKKQLIKCTTYDSEQNELSKAETVIEINIKSRDEIILSDVSLGYVDIDTESISCTVTEPPAPKIIDTKLKPLKDLRKNRVIQPNNSNNNNNYSKGGFIFENGDSSESSDDFSLPSLN